MADERRDLDEDLADCLTEAATLQSRLMELTERVYGVAGVRVQERADRAKVAGIMYGVFAHLESLKRLIREGD